MHDALITLAIWTSIRSEGAYLRSITAHHPPAYCSKSRYGSMPPIYLEGCYLYNGTLEIELLCNVADETCSNGM